MKNIKKKQKNIKKVIKKITNKKPSRSKLIKELDRVFSQYVRQYYSDKNGICECYTCGEKYHWKKIQNGHFITRGNYKYRWDIDNCRTQCLACNIYKHGNYIEYTLKMIKEYGAERIEFMKNDKQLIKISTSEIEERIKQYKLMLRN